MKFFVRGVGRLVLVPWVSDLDFATSWWLIFRCNLEVLNGFVSAWSYLKRVVVGLKANFGPRRHRCFS